MAARANTLALAAVIAGATIWSAPALARHARAEVECPAMPVTNDSEHDRSDGFGLTIAGFGANLDRSRSGSSKDVMMRSGKGWEDWSASAVLAHTCQLNRQIYADDLERQRDEFAALRERLLHRPEPQRPVRSQPAAPYRGVPVRAAAAPVVSVPRLGGVPLDQIWQPQRAVSYPWQARQAGIRSGSAVVLCWLTHAPVAPDCRVESESPAGHGFGAAAFQRSTQLRLRDSVRQAAWANQWVRIRINFKDPGN